MVIERSCIFAKYWVGNRTLLDTPLHDQVDIFQGCNTYNGNSKPNPTHRFSYIHNYTSSMQKKIKYRA